MSLDRSRRHLLALSFAAALAACGGSDEAPAIAVAPPPPPPPAAVAPTISVGPASLTVGEGASAQFTASASGNAPLSYQWSLDGSGPIGGATASTLSLATTQLQDHGKRFGVTVANAAGSATSALATLSVTERAWSVLELPPTGAAGTETAPTLFTPAVAVDSNGHTHAVFNQREANGGYAMWAAYKPAGAANFTGFTRLTAAAAPVAADSFAYEPVVAADAGGSVVAAWRSSRPDETSQVLAAVYLPSSGTWSSEQNASDPALLQVEGIAVVAAGNGAFEVLYVATPAAQAPRDIMARRVTVSGTALAWSDAVVLDDNPNASVGIKAASNAAGQVIVAWTHGAAFTETRAAVRSGSAAWSAPIDIGGLASENVQPASVALDSQGRGVVAMLGDEARVYVRRFAFGGDAFELTGSSQYVSNFTDFGQPPVVVAGLDGRFELLSIHNLGRQISRTTFDGSSWSALEPVLLIDSAEQLSVLSGLRAGVDGAGNLIVTWAQRLESGNWAVQRARRYHAGLAQWRDMAEFFNADRVRDNGIALAVQADGSALAVVKRGDGTVGQAVFK
jgi:hypothetical protein